MYELIKHPLIESLTGQVLKSIRVLKYQVIFEFDGDTLVDCENEIALETPELGMSVASITEGAEAFATQVTEGLFSLLEDQIVSTSISDNSRDLILRFRSGCSLIFKGDNDQYECFSINRAGEQLIV